MAKSIPHKDKDDPWPRQLAPWEIATLLVSLTKRAFGGKPHGRFVFTAKTLAIAKLILRMDSVVEQQIADECLRRGHVLVVLSVGLFGLVPVDTASRWRRAPTKTLVALQNEFRTSDQLAALDQQLQIDRRRP